jgi:hypothetical protein
MWRDIQDLIASIISHDFDLIISNELLKITSTKILSYIFLLCIALISWNQPKKSGFFYTKSLKLFLQNLEKKMIWLQYHFYDELHEIIENRMCILELVVVFTS